MGVGQDAISRDEQRADLMVSTLVRYVRAMGGTWPNSPIGLRCPFALSPRVGITGQRVADVASAETRASAQGTRIGARKDDGCAPTVPTLEGGGRSVLPLGAAVQLIEQVPCQSVTASGRY